MIHSAWLRVFLVIVACLMTGCGASNRVPLGKVSGQVTLDGKPLPDATVLFYPDSGGRMSGGRTDAEGRYTLQYSPDEPGGLIGKHKVVITTAIDPVPAGSDDGQPATPGRAELLPARYHTASELTAEVKSGSNSIDFPLSSK